MSVLIKGMELPTRCAVCALCDLRYGTKCKITKMSYYDSEGYPRGGYNDRPDWCPLVEITEPHGALIDRDALKADFSMGENCDKCGIELKRCEYDRVYTKMDFCGWLDDTPTVIEAEGSETE